MNLSLPFLLAILVIVISLLLLESIMLIKNTHPLVLMMQGFPFFFKQFVSSKNMLIATLWIPKILFRDGNKQLNYSSSFPFDAPTLYHHPESWSTLLKKVTRTSSPWLQLSLRSLIIMTYQWFNNYLVNLFLKSTQWRQRFQWAQHHKTSMLHYRQQEKDETLTF